MNDTKEKRCGLYLRVSTDRQAAVNEGSLDTQKERITHYINSKEDKATWKIHKIYREEGFSGKNMERPEFQRMMEDIKNNEINVVLVTKLDRITRSLMDFYNMNEVFNKHKVDFISLGDNFDTSTSTGRAILKITLVFAELEREQTSERTSATMEHKASSGLWCGGHPPLGYDFVPTEKGKLVVNLNEAKLVKLIFETYAKEASYMTTANIINKKGFRSKTYITKDGTKRGGGKFTNTSIQTILNNVVYRGKIGYKKNVYDGRHEAIINEQLFNQAHNVIGRNTDRKRSIKVSGKYNYLLSGLLECGKCGNAMTTTHCLKKEGVRYFYYKCSSKNHNGKNACGVKSISAPVLDNFVVSQIKGLYKNKKLLKDMDRLSKNETKNELIQLEKQKFSLLAVQKKVKAQMDKIVETLGNTGIDIVKDKLFDLDTQNKEVERELNNVQDKIDDVRNRVIDMETVKSSLAVFKAVFDELDDSNKREVMQLLIKNVVFTEDMVVINFFEIEGMDKKIRVPTEHLFDKRMSKLPGDNPLQNSKKGVLTENPRKLQSDKPRIFPVLMNTDSGFNHVRDSGVEPGSMGEDQLPVVPQPGAPESDVSAPVPVVEEESAHTAFAQPTRRTRSRVKPPIIEVVYVPTKFDPDDKKVVYGILADWILKDIEKEMREKSRTEG